MSEKRMCEKMNNKGYSVLEVLFKVLLVLVGALVLTAILGEQPVAASETKVSYMGNLLVAGESTIDDVKACYDLKKSGRRAYDIIKDGEPIATVKFTQEGVLKKITVNDDFLGGLLKKSNAPAYSRFGEDLADMGLVDANTLLTGSRTPDYSEMSLKKDGIKISWNYDLYRKNGKLEGTLTNVMYHSGEWYIFITF